MKTDEPIVFGHSPALERLTRPIDNGFELNVVGDPQSNVARYVNHPSGGLVAGTWDCRAGSWTGPGQKSAEIFTIMEGSVCVTSESGVSHDLRAGDTMYIPKGAKTHWKVDHYVKKAFVIMPHIDSNT